MKHAQDFDSVTTNAIGNEVSRLRNYQLTGTGNTPRATKAGLLRKEIDCFKHARDNQARCGGIFRSDVCSLLVKIAQGRTQPPNPH